MQLMHGVLCVSSCSYALNTFEKAGIVGSDVFHLIECCPRAHGRIPV